MIKKLSQILLIIILLIISFCVYLSVYGINTDKLNGIINEKISQRDSDFDIKYVSNVSTYFSQKKNCQEFVNGMIWSILIKCAYKNDTA